MNASLDSRPPPRPSVTLSPNVVYDVEGFDQLPRGRKEEGRNFETEMATDAEITFLFSVLSCSDEDDN